METTDDWIPGLLAIAEKRAPRIATAPIQGGWAGLYDMSPDYNAMIGEAPSVSRFLYATGFSGHGFLQGPATGEILRDLVLGRDAVHRRHADERRALRRRDARARVPCRLSGARRRRTSTSRWRRSATRSSPAGCARASASRRSRWPRSWASRARPCATRCGCWSATGWSPLVPNRGAIVPELRAVDVLEVYALRASLGTLALHKLMLSGGAARRRRWSASWRGWSARASGAGRDDAAEADLGYQAAVVAAAGLPRVAGEFERLTWQVRMFLGALEIDLLETLPRVVAEVQALHEAIVARDATAAERLWREKFERWIRDLVGRLDEDFDDELWVALTRGATSRNEEATSGVHA